MFTINYISRKERKMRGFGLLVLGLAFGLGPVLGQVSVKDSAVVVPMIKVNYSFQIPGGDLADRFGTNSTIGGGFMVKDRRGWLYGADGFFLFGGNVKEDGILDSISTSTQNLINANGEFADVRLFERGFGFSGRFGKVFITPSVNPNSGFMVVAGVGFIQHKIRIQNSGASAPQIDGEYKKGYDRLTNGLLLSQFVGYQYLGNRRLINFYGGFEFQQGFTQNRRTFNFDERRSDTESRLDLLYGIRVGWIVPLYKKVAREYYFD